LIAAKKIRPTDYITGEAPLSRLQQVLRHMLNRGGRHQNRNHSRPLMLLQESRTKFDERLSS